MLKEETILPNMSRLVVLPEIFPTPYNASRVEVLKSPFCKRQDHL